MGESTNALNYWLHGPDAEYWKSPLPCWLRLLHAARKCPHVIPHRFIASYSSTPCPLLNRMSRRAKQSHHLPKLNEYFTAHVLKLYLMP